MAKKKKNRDFETVLYHFILNYSRIYWLLQLFFILFYFSLSKWFQVAIIQPLETSAIALQSFVMV